ncbi:MAG: ferredoxin, partial [Ferroplasma sp. Type II]|uniref:hypothetical protein n=1 Tax=Ferroplasma sp. Type II TaxID=261388 RepID=UPI00038955BF
MGVIYILWLFTALMAIAMAYAIKSAKITSNIMEKFYVYLILGMMNSMLIGTLLYYILNLSIVRAVEISAILMMVEVIPFFFKFLSDLMREKEMEKSGFLFFYTMFLVILDELIMSVDFNLISSSSYLPFLLSTPFNALALAVSTYWFVFTMAFEMLITSFMLRNSLKKFVLIIFSVQSAVMLLMPTAIYNKFYSAFAVYFSGIVMTAFFIYMFEYLYRKQSLHKTEGKYVLQLLTAYTFMMAGVFIWQYTGNLYLISISMIL